MSAASLDRRLTAARADLAAEHLRGLVDAPRYAEGQGMRIVAASAPLRRSPQVDAPLETEALFGETVTVYDESEGWAWAQLERDQYVGYLPEAALGAPSAPTHRVAALRTHAYPGPAIKLPPRMALSLSAQLTIVRQDGDFSVSDDGLYFWSRSVAELSANEPDWVAVAERLIETPYLWGGRTSEGIDCSGLVQWSFAQAGVTMPRVAADQARTGPAVPVSQLQPGDLLFYHTDPTDPGYISHVTIYLGDGKMIQAPETGENVEVVPADTGSEFAGAVRVDPALAAAVAGSI